MDLEKGSDEKNEEVGRSSRHSGGGAGRRHGGHCRVIPAGLVPRRGDLALPHPTGWEDAGLPAQRRTVRPVGGNLASHPGRRGQGNRPPSYGQP